MFLKKPKQEILKLVKQKPKYREFWSVFQLNAGSTDETFEALNYYNFLISCGIQTKLLSTPPFSLVKNTLLQFI